MLSDLGVKRGYTKEKMDGTYKRPPQATEEIINERLPDYLIEMTKKFYDERSDIFEQDKSLKDKLLDKLKGDRIKLRKYPEIVAAMYASNLDEVPEDL